MNQVLVLLEKRKKRWSDAKFKQKWKALAYLPKIQMMKDDKMSTKSG